MLRVVELTAQETHPLRASVLRRDTATTEVRFPEDDLPGVVHLGVVDGDHLVGISTWVPRPSPDEPDRPAVQLRGMATAPTHQGRGVGALLLDAGVRRADESGATSVWANARDTALGFYLRHGFEAVGEGFVDAATQLAHHVVVRRAP